MEIRNCIGSRGRIEKSIFWKVLKQKIEHLFFSKRSRLWKKIVIRIIRSFPSFGTRRSKSSELPHISIRKTIKRVSTIHHAVCSAIQISPISRSNFSILEFLGENLEEILCIVDKYFTKRIFCLISFCEISLSLIFDNEISVSCPSQLYRTSRWCSVHDYKV